MVLRHVLSILLLPFTVTVVLPVLLLEQDRAQAAVGLRAAGALVAALGLVLVFVTIAHFARKGRGTLAPWDPPRHLVVSGVYRHVRNPMISGVILILIGESLFFASTAIALLAAGFFAINAVLIPLYEERELTRRFGAEYGEYKRNVPRWVPRLTVWRGGTRPPPA
jgi:protein-S-isoprenylcysteine O-methyltransferase Ste14